LLRFFFGVKLGPEVAAPRAVLWCMLRGDGHLAGHEVDLGEAATALELATTEHLRLHMLAYGTQYVRPKHHWMQDIPDQIRQDGVVVDAFVVERVHLRVKAVAEHVDNTRAFERSVLSSLVTSHIRSLETWELGDRLIGSTGVLDCGSNVRVGGRMSVYSVKYKTGDVVMRGDDVALLTACALQADELYGFVRPLGKVADITGHASSYVLSDGLALWSANELMLALAWRRRPDGHLLVVRR